MTLIANTKGKILRYRLAKPENVTALKTYKILHTHPIVPYDLAA